MQEKHSYYINANIPIISIIIISTFAGLTDATPSCSFCNSFALSVFFSHFHQTLEEKEVSESVEI